MPAYHTDARYSIVRIEIDADWAHLVDLTGGHLKPTEAVKIQSALAESCKSIVVERDYVCKDYRDTYSNYYSKKFASYSDKCTRLLFFRAEIDPATWWQVETYAESFLGYCVVRPTRIKSIGRMVIAPEACAGSRGYICRTSFVANLAGVELKVSGFPHISQDTDVTVCAHAACWSVFRYFSERYPSYPEIYPYQVTQLNTDLSKGRLLPSRGVWMYQVAEMFSRFGFYPRIYSRKDYDLAELCFERLLYWYLESGIPVVLGMKPDHAVTAIGHTSDFTLAVDEPGIIFSDHFLTGVIINDDNEMPYETLPRDDYEDRFIDEDGVSIYPLSDVDEFVVPLYEKVYLAAEDIETLTLALLADPELGVAARAPSLQLDDLVIRIFLTTSRSYKSTRRDSPLPHDLSRIHTQLPMPKFVWVSEISTRGMYPHQRIVGEIIWDATAAERDAFPWLVIHYPEFLKLNDRDSGTGGLRGERQFEAPEPYAMYIHNLHRLP